MKNDPTLTDDQRSYTLKQIRAVTQRGLFPTAKAVGKASVRYLRKDYHPSKEGSTSLAVAYLATSPAARAATV
jgi:predicted metal-dependent hydrolase